VRDLGKIPKADNVKLSDQELNLGTNLIEEMSDEFDPEKYRDEYRIRVLAMLKEKSKGREITVAPAPPREHSGTCFLCRQRAATELSSFNSNPVICKPACQFFSGRRIPSSGHPLSLTLFNVASTNFKDNTNLLFGLLLED
jgi:hypothetical protein